MIGNDIDAFRTSAQLVLMECTNPTVKIREFDLQPNLQKGEFLAILNLYRMQSRAIDRLTKGMSDEEACLYVREETNKALEEMARNGTLELHSQKGPLGQLIPAVSLDRVICHQPKDGATRLFVGVCKGTSAIW